MLMLIEVKYRYSELPNKRACSLNIFEKKIHPARNFSCNEQCSVINLFKISTSKVDFFHHPNHLSWPARLLGSSEYSITRQYMYLVAVLDNFGRLRCVNGFYLHTVLVNGGCEINFVTYILFQRKIQRKQLEPLQMSPECHTHKKDFYTGGGNVWCDIAKYIVKWTQEKWACDSHDDATPLSFQLQVTEDFF